VDAIDAHDLFDVLQALFAEVDELRIDLAAHLSPGVLRDRNAAGLGNAFEPSREIDAVAINVIAFNYDIADVDADTEHDRPVFRAISVDLPHSPLNGYGAFNGIYDAPKLDQSAVAHKLNNATAVLTDRGIDEVFATRPKRGECTTFIRRHEAAVSNHISGEDRCKPPLQALSSHLARAPQLSPRKLRVYGPFLGVSIARRG